MTTQRPHRGWRFWIKRVLAGLGFLLAALAVAGAAYQAVAAALDRAAFPPPGRLVDAGGFKLHILCEGAAVAGRPTVILESGLATTTPIWHRVQQEVAQRARVCAYDRAGIGWSQPSPQPRDAAHIAAELHVLLKNAGIAAPYVLVGHSSGGLYVRAYQRLYPRDVAGLVLLDSTPENFANASDKSRADYDGIRRIFMFTPVLAALGVIRLLPVCSEGLPSDFPAAQRDQYRALCTATPPWAVERDEHAHLPDPLPAAVPLTVPLGVFTSGKNVQRMAVWGPLQARLAALSPDSLHRVFARADHASFLVDKTYAHESAALILKVVDAAAAHRALRGS